MFDGCTNLNKVVALFTTDPAVPSEDGDSDGEQTRGKENNFDFPFDDEDTGTTTPTDTNFKYPYTKNWLRGVSTTGLFVKSASATWTATGASAVPDGWTVEQGFDWVSDEGL